MNDNYKNFCLKCRWNDNDYGCTCPRGEIYQCALYRHTYPEKVEAFKKVCKEWSKEKTKILGSRV